MYNWKNNSFNGKLLHFLKCFIVAAFVQCLSPTLITFPFIFIAVYLILTFVRFPMLKKPKFKITYEDVNRYGEKILVKESLTKDTWNKLKLTRLEAAWLYFVCLMKSNDVSIKAIVNDRVFYIWGEQYTESRTVYSKPWGAVRPDRVYYTMGPKKPEGMYPKDYQMMNFGNMSERRLLTFINLNYRNVKDIEEVYKLKKKSIILDVRL